MKLPPILLSLILVSILIELAFSKPSGFWFLLAPVFAYGWWIVAVIFHEAGHGAMAQCLGWRVVRLEAGSMTSLGIRRKIFGWRWTLTPYEFGGTAFVFPKSVRGYRWQSFLVYLAGPLANVVLVSTGLVGLGFALEVNPPAQLAACVLILTNLIMLMRSLRPTLFDLAGRREFNDMAGMWQALTNRLARPKLAVLHGLGFEALARTEEGDSAGAARLANKVLEMASTTEERAEAVDWAATIMMRAGALERAIPLAREGLAMTTDDDRTLPRLSNSLAYTLLVRGSDQDVSEALALARTACNTCPNSAAYIGTLGAALALAGQLTSGLELLNRSSASTPRPQERAENECWKALGYAKASRIAEAKACVANAERLDPCCFLLPQVRESLRKHAMEC